MSSATNSALTKEEPTPTWSEALRRECLSHNCLTATADRVLRIGVTGSLQDRIRWNDEGIVEVLASAYKKRNEENGPPETTEKGSTFSWLVGKVWGTAEDGENDDGSHDFDDSLYSTVVKDDDDVDKALYSPDKVNNTATEAPEFVDLDLALDAIDQLGRIVQDSCESDVIPVFTLDRSRSSFNAWLSKQEDDYPNLESSILLSKLPLPQLTVLIECTISLVSKRLILKKRRPKEVDLVAVGFESDDSDIAMNTRLTVYELTQAQENIQSLIDGWTERATSAKARAIQHSRHGRQCAGVAELRLVKLLDHAVDQKFGELSNIQTALLAVESTQHRSDIMRTLQSATSTLKSLNTNINVEDVDSVVLDLQQELDDLQDINQANTVDGIFRDSDDDEALLRELDKLEIVECAENDAELANSEGSVSASAEPAESAATKVALPSG